VDKAANTEEIAAALSLRADDIGFDEFKPTRWSGGVPMTSVPVRSLHAIQRCQMNLVEWDSAFGQDPNGIAYLFWARTGSDVNYRLHRVHA
jgi:trans-2,3-dihydro-3-hydroxyanthranilate isomerase